MTTAPTELKPSAPAIGGVRVKPRLTDAAIRAACKAHFGSDNVDGLCLTVQDKDWSFREGFTRMWHGAWSALPNQAGAAALEPQAVDDVLDKAVEAALHADIIPLTGKHAGAAGVRLIDYLSLDASAAIELGVALTEKDVNGKPAFHWYSDIGCMEHEEVQRAILRPLIKAALQAAKEPSHG